ncbi:hypothetical protein K491DRAFT_228405 [Lophiostoma macrostomum CBS 122681]|uniref:Uncharacterized protein n=1 Tax=Lophiostoma macrostomum CBS 122681 TaxID=1314788 RepID=A0A6A6SLR4_9PLEO|nr:hypothetical protein K491DRAFT_228405 [Lophiostoma macrostomum CBS 122681]
MAQFHPQTLFTGLWEKLLSLLLSAHAIRHSRFCTSRAGYLGYRSYHYRTCPSTALCCIYLPSCVPRTRRHLDNCSSNDGAALDYCPTLLIALTPFPASTKEVTVLHIFSSSSLPSLTSPLLSPTLPSSPPLSTSPCSPSPSPLLPSPSLPSPLHPIQPHPSSTPQPRLLLPHNPHPLTHIFILPLHPCTRSTKPRCTSPTPTCPQRTSLSGTWVPFRGPGHAVGYDCFAAY